MEGEARVSHTFEPTLARGVNSELKEKKSTLNLWDKGQPNIVFARRRWKFDFARCFAEVNP